MLARPLLSWSQANRTDTGGRMRRVAVIGVGVTKFGKHERTSAELFAEAAREALADAELSPGAIQALYYGNVVGSETEKQLHMGPQAAHRCRWALLSLPSDTRRPGSGNRRHTCRPCRVGRHSPSACRCTEDCCPRRTCIPPLAGTRRHTLRWRCWLWRCWLLRTVDLLCWPEYKSSSGGNVPAGAIQIDRSPPDPEAKPVSGTARDNRCSRRAAAAP